jgi:hypothetical protein
VSRTASVPDRRAAVGIGVIAALVILQVVIVVAVIAGARDQDLTVQRMDTSRAYYAADTVAHMAAREVYKGTDEDGDGGIGSLASGVVASGPAVSGVHAAAALAASGSTSTLTVKGTSSLATRALTFNMVQSGGAVTPFAAFATNTNPALPAAREYTSGAWGAAQNTSSLSGNVAWEVLRTCPTGTADPARALVSLVQDNSLWISQFGGGVWGAASSLTSDAGTFISRVVGAEYEHKTGNLMVVYRKGAGTSLYYRTYTSATPSEQSFSLGLGTAPTWIELAQKPNANELVAVVAAGSNLYAGVWNGSSWGNTKSLEAALPTVGRPFHVAYMNKSGTAIIVWTATSGAPKYITWNGTSWGAASTMPAIAGGYPAGWVKLAGSSLHSSDEVVAALLGTNKQVNLNVWSGTAWGTNLVAETTAAAAHQARVDVAYQRNGSKALAVWHKSGQTSLLYRTWSGGAWSSQQTGPDMTSDSKSIKLDRGYGSDEIMMLVRRAGPLDYTDFNVYSQNGTVTTGTTVISGLSGGSTSGVSLPVAPSATAGATNLSLTSGTISPGAYGTLTLTSPTSNVTLTAGTYVFSSVSMQGTMTLNSTGGPITVNITSGGLTGENNCTFVNTGESLVQFNIIGGDLLFKNSATMTNVTILVYNGSATFKNSADGQMNLWASGNIDFKNNGTISPNGVGYGTPGKVSAVLWTNGAAGSMTDLCTSNTPAATNDPFALAGSPMPGSPVLNGWASVAPQ